MMSELRDSPVGRQKVNLKVAKAAFTEPVLGQVLSQIESGGYLITEYNVLKLMEYAFRHCYSDEDVLAELESLAWMILAINEHSHIREQADDAPDLGVRIDGEPISHASTLAADMAANQYFNASRDAVSLIAQFQRRWREMPAADLSSSRSFNLGELYDTTVGVPFEDLVTLATMLWAMCAQGKPVLNTADVAERLSWEPERLDTVLGLLARDRRGFVAELDADEFPGPWSFNAFERFPIFVDGRRLVVLDPDFLINRVYGWLPIFDIRNAMMAAASDEAARSAVFKQMNTITNYLRDNTERYVLEVLEQFAPRHGLLKRLWDERELKAAYPGKNSGKVCDAVMGGPGAWVAFEVSSRLVQRKLASSAAPEALLDDVMFGIVKKAGQLEATLNRLKQNESNLTGRPAEQRRRFVPVLVIGEGFPLGPITRAVIDYRLQQTGVLQQPEFQPLHILGVHELELLEYAVTAGGRELIEILDAHARSTMAPMNLSDFLTEHERPQRQVALWERAMEIVAKRLAR